MNNQALKKHAFCKSKRFHL